LRGSAFQRADFFFLPTDFRGDGVEYLGEVIQPRGEAGDREQLAVAGPVAVDDLSEFAAPIAGGAADPAGLGDRGEGHVATGGEEPLAGGLDSLGVGVGSVMVGRLRCG
jgi:hypothetical protein